MREDGKGKGATGNGNCIRRWQHAASANPMCQPACSTLTAAADAAQHAPRAIHSGPESLISMMHTQHTHIQMKFVTDHYKIMFIY